jgi:hypothetical protein
MDKNCQMSQQCMKAELLPVVFRYFCIVRNISVTRSVFKAAYGVLFAA